MAVNTDYTQNANLLAPDGPLIKTGRITMSATAITAADYLVQALGFTPRYVRFENLTDRISVEWWNGMADDTCLKTAAAGTKTLETTNKGITVCDDSGSARSDGRSFMVSQNATLAVIAASKVLTWIAIG